MKRFTIQCSFIIMSLTIFLLSGCQESRDPKWEAQKKASVEAFLNQAKGIQHGEITVDSSTKTLTINDLNVEKTFTFESKPFLTLKLKADTLVASHVNFDSKESVVEDLTEKATFKNVSYTFEAISQLQSSLGSIPKGNFAASSTISDLSFDKVRGDVASFLATVSSDSIDIAQAEKLATFHADAVTSKKVHSFSSKENPSLFITLFAHYSPENISGDLDIEVEETSAHNVSFEQVDNYLVKNFVAKLDQKKVASFDKATFKKISIPGFYAKLGNKDSKAFLKQDFFIDGVDYNGISIVTSNGDIGIKNFGGTFNKTGEQILFEGHYKNLTFPSKVLELVESFKKISISKLHPKPFDLSANIEVKAFAENGTIPISIKSAFIEKMLGNTSISLNLIVKGITEKAPFSSSYSAFNAPGTSILLKDFSYIFKDSGIIDFLGSIAEVVGGSSYEKAKELAQLRRKTYSNQFAMMCTSSVGPKVKPFCNELEKIIKEPGKIEINLAPTQPLPADRSLTRLLEDTEGSGLTIKYTK